MPELPEVECVRRGIESRVLGERIVSVIVHRRDVVENLHQKRTPLRTALGEGARIGATQRLGKRMALVLDSGACVEVRLGMTGQLLVRGETDRDGDRDHVHVTWNLSGGRQVLFRDPRRFGGLAAVSSLEDLRERWSVLGPDALGVTPAQLRAALGDSRAAVKSLLMDQKRVAGVGNIYADEALFAARIRPTRPGRGCTPQEIAVLAREIRRVLGDAIRNGGSTIRDYRGVDGAPGSQASRHCVYGRSGRLCVACGGPLETTWISQRTTVFCPACQS